MENYPNTLVEMSVKYSDSWCSTAKLSRGVTTLQYYSVSKRDVHGLMADIEASIKSYISSLSNLNPSRDYVAISLIENEIKKLERLKKKLINAHPEFFI